MKFSFVSSFGKCNYIKRELHQNQTFVMTLFYNYMGPICFQYHLFAYLINLLSKYFYRTNVEFGVSIFMTIITSKGIVTFYPTITEFTGDVLIKH